MAWLLVKAAEVAWSIILSTRGATRVAYPLSPLRLKGKGKFRCGKGLLVKVAKARLCKPFLGKKIVKVAMETWHSLVKVAMRRRTLARAKRGKGCAGTLAKAKLRQMK